MRNLPRSSLISSRWSISKTWKILMANRSTKFSITALLRFHISQNHTIGLTRECTHSIITPIRTSTRIWEIFTPKRELWSITPRTTRWTSQRNHKSKMNKPKLLDLTRIYMARICVTKGNRPMITMVRCCKIDLPAFQTSQDHSLKLQIKTSILTRCSTKLCN